MPVEIINCEQGTEEWFRARMGIPTASQFRTVMAQGKGGGESITRRKYMLQLVGEIITDTPMESYSNDDMLRGKEHEPDARKQFSFEHDVEIEQVGFIRNGGKGCSPDGLIGKNGMVEFKSASPHILLDMLLTGKIPTEHIQQLQGNLWVAERSFIFLVVYWPKLPLFIRRIERDETEIRRIAGAVADFNVELRQTLEKVRALS